MSSTVTSDLISHAYTYAWLGTAGKSVSTLTRDGIEIRRNCDTNPGFEVDTSGWSTSGVSTTTYAWTGTADASTSTQTVNGTLKRTNLSLNPRFGTGTDEWFLTWNGQNAADTMRLTSANGPKGGYTLYVKPTAQGSGVEWQPKVATDRSVFLSLWVAEGSNVKLKIFGSNQNGTDMVKTGAPVGGWQRYASPSAVTSLGGTIYVDAFGDQGVGFYLGNIMVEEAASVGDYFDGGFASTTQGVDVLRSTTVSHSGLASLQVRWQSPNRQGGFASHTVLGLADDTDYMVSMWVSIPKRLSKPVLLSVTDSATQGPNAVTLQEATAGWQRFVFPYRTLVGSTGFSIWLYDPNSYTGSYLAQSVYIDDIVVETGSAELPYFDGSTPSYVEYENTQPLVVNGWEEAATGRNIINPIIGGDIDVTLQPSSLRQGAFELVYQDEAEAAAAFAMHQRPSTFTISDSDRASTAMTYIVDGRISRALDDESRDYWIVRVEYQEVAT